MVKLVIPVYHSLKTLCTALDSLVAQTSKDFEVTIVIDADREDYSDIIKKYDNFFHITTLVMEKNGGPGLARQYATDIVALNSNDLFHTYVMYLDSDDMLMPRAIEALSGYMESHDDVDVISSDILVEQVGKDPMRLSADVNTTWVLGKIYRLSYLVEKEIRFHPELRLDEDAYFNVVAINCTARTVKIHEILGYMRANPNSLTRANGGDNFFTTGAEPYLLSQIWGLARIIEITKQLNPVLLAETILNLYPHYMRCRRFGIGTTNADAEFKKFLQFLK